jgi:hypothetical protein
LTPADAFLAALSATGRSAFTEFKRVRGVASKDGDAVRALKQEHDALDLLGSPELRDFADAAVRASAGHIARGGDPFPATLWLHGATCTEGGRDFTGSLRDFAELLLTERAKAVAPKREGWVIEPSTNPSGIRENEHTLAMHALFLDCDGAGEWFRLLGYLNERGFACVAYQSGGWSPSTPKWRVVMPLSAPFDTSSEPAREAWKRVYNGARVVLGALAGLRGSGFDAATETPCCPWFLTERRDPSDPPRQVWWREGHSLDLGKLIGILPEPAPVPRETHLRVVPSARDLSAERAEEIIDALTAATASVSSERRSLYMSLPGTMLSRGLTPDDVRLICAEVSSRYPRAHADKHADNLHCVETTIAKWETEGSAARVTQIKTLNDLHPDIAAALDDVLPGGDEKFRRMAMDLIDGRGAERSEAAAVSEVAVDEGEDNAPDWQVPVTEKKIRSFVVSLRRKKASWKKTKDAKDAIRWALLDRVLSKKPLASPVEKDAVTGLSGLQSLQRLAGMLAYKLPRNTPWDAVRELVRMSLVGLVPTGADPVAWFDLLKQMYVKQLGDKLEAEAKKKQDLEERRDFYSQYILSLGER